MLWSVLDVRKVEDALVAMGSGRYQTMTDLIVKMSNMYRLAHPGSGKPFLHSLGEVQDLCEALMSALCAVEPPAGNAPLAPLKWVTNAGGNQDVGNVGAGIGGNGGQVGGFVPVAETVLSAQEQAEAKAANQMQLLVQVRVGARGGAGCLQPACLYLLCAMGHLHVMSQTRTTCLSRKDEIMIESSKGHMTYGMHLI